MNKVINKRSCSDLDKLLEISVSQHGYWLINHKEIIQDELHQLLHFHGLVRISSVLNELDNPITKGLYKKIKEFKDGK